MTLPDNQERGKDSDNLQMPKREDIPPEYIGSVLRAEIMPASELTPERFSIGTFLRRLNMRLVAVVILFFILIGTSLVCSLGPGKPILERSLLSLRSRYVETTLTVTSTSPSQTIETKQIEPTSTSTSTSTVAFTPVPPSKTPTNTPQVTPTEEDICVNAVDISIEDVGSTMCVRGLITGLEEREVGFIVYFSDQRGVFYLVTYDLVWDDAEPGDCIQITGEIQQLASTPVLVFGWNNLPEFCP